MKTIQNTSDYAIVFTGASYQATVYPGKVGDLPDAVADKYAERKRCVIVSNDERPASRRVRDKV